MFVRLSFGFFLPLISFLFMPDSWEASFLACMSCGSVKDENWSKFLWSEITYFRKDKNKCNWLAYHFCNWGAILPHAGFSILAVFCQWELLLPSSCAIIETQWSFLLCYWYWGVANLYVLFVNMEQWHVACIIAPYCLTIFGSGSKHLVASCLL